MKCLRLIMNICWTEMRKNQWVLEEAGVERSLLRTVKVRNLIYFGHIMRREGGCLEKDIMQGTLPGNRKRGRPRTNWLGNIKDWTGLEMKEMIRATEDRRRWRNIVHDAADPWSEDG